MQFGRKLRGRGIERERKHHADITRGPKNNKKKIPAFSIT
jgi:hypothetical protein